MTCLHNHDQILEFLRKIFFKGFQIYQNYLCALNHVNQIFFVFFVFLLYTVEPHNQSVLIERVATLWSKVTQKSSTLSSITKEFPKIVPICLYMICKNWSSQVRRSYRKLRVFPVQKTRKLGMCCVKCDTFERL